MVKKMKTLGMGLDLLLAAGELRTTPGRGTEILHQVRETLDHALREDEAGNACEAYYLYRKLVDSAAGVSLDGQDELAALLSKAFNNAAIILYEQGNAVQARDFLHKSLAINPNNLTAHENLIQLRD